MQLIPYQSAGTDTLFLLVLSTDHITGATGVTPTVTIRKNAGSFITPAGAVDEIGNGWYRLAGNATDRNTYGPMILHATATGADPFDEVYLVIDWFNFNFDPNGWVRADILGVNNESAGDDFLTAIQVTIPGLPSSGQNAIAAAQAIMLNYPNKLATASDGSVTGTNATSSGLTITEHDKLMSLIGVGTGDVTVDHDYGGVDALRVLHGAVPVDNVLIQAYVAADYTAGAIDPNPPTTYTGSDGRWTEPLKLDAGVYKLLLSRPGAAATELVNLTVA